MLATLTSPSATPQLLSKVIDVGCPSTGSQETCTASELDDCRSLGLSQISITLNTYSHVAPALQHEAMAKMDDVLSQVAVRAAVTGRDER